MTRFADQTEPIGWVQEYDELQREARELGRCPKIYAAGSGDTIAACSARPEAGSDWCPHHQGTRVYLGRVVSSRERLPSGLRSG